MKVLQVSHNYNVVGGSDAVFLATCDMLTKAGHQAIPFCIANPQNDPSPWDRYFPKSADTKAAPIADIFRYFYNVDAKAKLNDLLDTIGNVDVAHLHIYHGKQTPAILAVFKARGIPVIQTLHEYKLACPAYTMQRGDRPCDLCVQGSDLNCLRHRCKDNSLLRSAVMVAETYVSRLLGDIRLVDRFICVSEFQRQIMVQAGIPADKLHVLHNFVETPLGLNAGHDGYYLYVGRIEKLKGLQTLISAFSLTNNRLIIAGDGSWRDQLENQIQGKTNISFVGFQQGRDLTRLIARAKAIVVPSEWNENCPMSVLEAKAAGRPVIGANIGGIPELINHGVDGYLFEPGDVDGLIDAVATLELADHNELSENALNASRLHFSKDRHLVQLLDHYGDVIDPGLEIATGLRESC